MACRSTRCVIEASSLPLSGLHFVLFPVLTGPSDLGNGVLQANRRMSDHGCAAVMTGRGALIKPWLFQEFKDQRELNPSTLDRCLQRLAILTSCMHMRTVCVSDTRHLAHALS